MKKYIVYVFFGLSLAGFALSCGSGSKAEADENNKKDKIETVKLKPATKKFKELAEKSNKSLPQPLPDGIRLDKVEAVSEKEYKYYLTFTKGPEVSADEFKRNAKVALSMGLQNNKGEDLDMFRSNKMTIIYAYYKMDRSLFAEIRIEPGDYIK